MNNITYRRIYDHLPDSLIIDEMLFNFIIPEKKILISVSPKSGFTSTFTFINMYYKRENLYASVEKTANVKPYLENPEWVTIFIIRNPVERFLSGYLNKIVKPKKSNITFSDFVNYCHANPGILVNIDHMHFASQCSPIINEYQHIIDTESLFYFLIKLCKEKNMECPDLTKIWRNDTDYGEKNDNAANLLPNEWGSNIPLKESFLVQDLVKKIEEMYSYDVSIFKKYIKC